MRTRAPTAGLRIRVSGMVQGVGFRPFVYRSAKTLGLSGWVANVGTGLMIEVAGPAESLDGFVSAVSKGPPAACMVEVSAEAVELSEDQSGFAIRESLPGSAGSQPPVDIGVCPECLAETCDPGSKRFNYPFTNCSQCGPRYTIVQGLPYDRPATTMAGFRMCPSCHREFSDPGDRRFHAQPIACPDCGPTVSFKEGDCTYVGGGAIDRAAALIREDQVVAVKGLGGYHLMCRAGCDTAVQEIRGAKGRDAKPMAVMVSGLEAAEAIGHLDRWSRRLLEGSDCPIVIVGRRADADLAAGLAPGLSTIGIMIAYSPLHHLLTNRVREPLVATSANLSGRPISSRPELLEQDGLVYSGVLDHDRPIANPCDDTVVRSGPSKLLLRYGRGQAPGHFRLVKESVSVLALGGDSKNTVALTKGRDAFISQHVGDLICPETLARQAAVIGGLKSLLQAEPEVVVVDRHPDYVGATVAAETGLPVTTVQHHHAHIAAVIVEHELSGPVVGVAFDGSGWGDDSRLWGGEFLLADLRSYERLGHLLELPLPGGEAAVTEPWRTAVAALTEAGWGPDQILSLLGLTDDSQARAVVEQLRIGLNTPMSSGAGRLFDAAAAIITGIRRQDYDGQAPAILEEAARGPGPRCRPSPAIRAGRHGWVVDWRPLFDWLAGGVRSGQGRPGLAAGFHLGLAESISTVAVRLAEARGLDQVVLSGGVFQNRMLLGLVKHQLSQAGLRVYHPQRLPANDEGLSLGQAAIGSMLEVI